MKSLAILAAVVASLSFFGCQSVYNLDTVSSQGEGTMVFVRPNKYSILGTTSIRDHLEITYQQLVILPNGYANLKCGVRNRGGQHWWHSSGCRVHLAAKPYFYSSPVNATANWDGTSFTSDLKSNAPGRQGPSGAPLYVGARTPFSLGLGETQHLSFLAPVQGVGGFQVVFAEE